MAEPIQGVGPLKVIDMSFLSEDQYRALNALSYSRLSDIEEVGIAAVNASAVKDISGLRGIVLGSIVDTVVSEKLIDIPGNVGVVQKVPGEGAITHLIAKMLCKEFEFTKVVELDQGEILTKLKEYGYLRNTVNEKNYMSKILNYYEYIEMMKLGIHRHIVTGFDIEVCTDAIKRLREHPMFSVGYNLVNPNRQIIYQQKFLAEINGIQIKCMIDALWFDHENKKIIPIDIKTGVVVSEEKTVFYDEAYLKYNYYIQQALYRKIVLEYFKYYPKYKDYSMDWFHFVYSTTHPREFKKIRHTFNHAIGHDGYMDAFRGFSHTDQNGKRITKLGIANLLNTYKDNVINPATREELYEVITNHEAEHSILVKNPEDIHFKPF